MDEFDEIDYSQFDLSADLEGYLTDYTNRLMPLKLEIANAPEHSVLAEKIKDLFELQQELIAQLAAYSSEGFSTLEVKQSDPFKVHESLKEIRESGLLESQIKDYLCNKFDSGEHQSPLLQSVARANKIVANER